MKPFGWFVLALVAGLAWAAPVRAGEDKPQVRVIVRFHGKADPGLLKRHGGTTSLHLDARHAVSGTLPASALGRIRALPEVASVQEDAVAGILGAPTVSRQVSTQPSQTVPWGIHRIGADRCWGACTGQGVRVAVVDTGINDKHPDFKDANGLSRIVLGANFVRIGREPKDNNGHGTHVTGTLGASNNAIGVVGVAPGCTPVAVKVLDRHGSGFDSWIVAGIDWATANNCQVITMSLGGPGDVQILHDACDQAVATGVVVVAAAGNSGDATPSYPGAYPSVICVGATDSSDQLAFFSTTGPQVDLVAPGVDILSTLPHDRYQSWSGTSMATPHVAGTAALALASGRYPDANGNGQVNDEVRAALQATAQDINAAALPGRDSQMGYGLVDAQAVVTGTPTPP